MKERTKIDFTGKRKKLHAEIVAEIISLMKGANLTMVDFDKVGISRPKILRWLDKLNSYELVEVRFLCLDGASLKYKASYKPGSNEYEKDWWSVNKCIAHTFVTELYDAIYNLVYSVNVEKFR